MKKTALHFLLLLNCFNVGNIVAQTQNQQTSLLNQSYAYLQLGQSWDLAEECRVLSLTGNIGAGIQLGRGFALGLNAMLIKGVDRLNADRVDRTFFGAGLHANWTWRKLLLQAEGGHTFLYEESCGRGLETYSFESAEGVKPYYRLTAAFKVNPYFQLFASWFETGKIWGDYVIYGSVGQRGGPVQLYFRTVQFGLGIYLG